MLSLQKKACTNCVHGSPVPVNHDVLCYFKGIVSGNYSCSRHRYAPVNLKSKRKCIQCEFFIQSAKEGKGNKNIGYCKLFTVRTFDGTTKNACSRFSSKLGGIQGDSIVQRESYVV